jgi:hypothetical protein
MVKRRPLAEGLNSTPKADPEKEQAFVDDAKKAKKEPAKNGAKPKPEPTEQFKTPPTTSEAQPEQPASQPLGRSRLSTQLRSDLGAALKRASLERQLAGQTPNTVQDILDEALEPWLKSHGYLK